MFGLKKLVSTREQVKIVASNNFIKTLSQNLNSASEKSIEVSETTKENYSLILEDSILSFENFVLSDGEDRNSFRKALDGFVKASSLRPSKPESYFYLSTLFHLFGENETAIKYLKTVEFIAPDFDGLEYLRNDIINTSSVIQQEIDFAYSSRIKPVQTFKEASPGKPEFSGKIGTVQRLTRK